MTACEKALSSGWAYGMGGGMHHALSFTGQGFCLLNDGVIALRSLQKAKRIRRALIIDVDIHKGDGTIEITFGDESITTVDFHGGKTWPLCGGLYAQSNLPADYNRPIFCGSDYLPTLEKTLRELPRDFDLALVVQGSDLFEGDILSSSRELGLSLAQMLERDQLIHRWLSSCGIPQAYCMGGGYGESTWKVYFQYLYWALNLA